MVFPQFIEDYNTAEIWLRLLKAFPPFAGKNECKRFKNGDCSFDDQRDGQVSRPKGQERMSAVDEAFDESRSPNALPAKTEISPVTYCTIITQIVKVQKLSKWVRRQLTIGQLLQRCT